MSSLPTPKISDIKEKTVLVRVDFNVPLRQSKSKKGEVYWQVADDQRLSNALETIHFLLENKAKVILISHLGRPEGKVKAAESLRPVAQYLRRNFALAVNFAPDCVGPQAEKAAQELQEGEILLLENLRFHAEEEKNDPAFAGALAKLADVYINEAFSASHRAHASIVGIPKLLPAFAGFALAFEEQMLNSILQKAKAPFVVIMGGAKIADKVQTIKNLAKKADFLLLGGGLSNAFLKAGGIETHQSYLGGEVESTLQTARAILRQHKTERSLLQTGLPAGRTQTIPLPKIVLPLDVRAAANQKVNSIKEVQTIELLKDVRDSKQDLPLQYLDLGPKTINLYRFIIGQAKTVFWNGPLGVFENPLFSQASRSIARAIAALDKNKITTVCGGGETAEVINQLGLRNRFTHLSTAGGAALEFLGGAKLPGLEMLRKNS